MRANRVVSALVALASLSCAQLNGLLAGAGITPPTVTFHGASLVRSPSKRDLSAYFCPKLAREKGLAIGGDLVCSQLFGSAPRASEMALGFDLRFTVENPNQVPLPLSEILTAITVFPEATAQNLGAVCMRLCDPGDTACQAGQDPNSCRSARGDIRTLNDFPNALASMLVAEGLTAATGGATPSPGSFRAPKVLASSAVEVVARFSMLPEAMLPLFEQLARQSATQLRAGKELTFAIPYRLQGTVFADAGSLGRVAAGFGPVSGDWALPASRLLP
jgi:hypothetical protein